MQKVPVKDPEERRELSRIGRRNCVKSAHRAPETLLGSAICPDRRAFARRLRSVLSSTSVRGPQVCCTWGAQVKGNIEKSTRAFLEISSAPPEEDRQGDAQTSEIYLAPLSGRFPRRNSDAVTPKVTGSEEGGREGGREGRGRESSGSGGGTAAARALRHFLGAGNGRGRLEERKNRGGGGAKGGGERRRRREILRELSAAASVDFEERRAIGSRRAKSRDRGLVRLALSHQRCAIRRHSRENGPDAVPASGSIPI